MKKLIAIAFFAVTLTVHAQTKLDTLIFNKVNEYRAENCLPSLKWSESATCVAQNQVEYCYRIKYIFHYQTDSSVNDSSFKIEPNFQKRFKQGGVNISGKTWTIAENLLVYVDTTDNYTESLEKVANETISGWKESPEHNAMMLRIDLEYAAVAHTIGKEFVKRWFDPIMFEDYETIFQGKAYYIALDAYR